MVWIQKGLPALVLAPMEGVTDFPMRALMSERGGFSFCVSEFFRISQDIPYPSAFPVHIPELHNDAKTATGTPVQVQLLGGNPERMAQSAVNACLAGATAIDLNFGCPAPIVNRNDGGASLLKHPDRIEAVVAAVRAALPAQIPVSAKLRLGWETPDDVFENARRAQNGGAQWITIHARTKAQGYRPPVFWKYIGEARRRLSVPVVANGDIWTLDDFDRCREETGCEHFMIGRGALANPALPLQISNLLNGNSAANRETEYAPREWEPLLERFHALCTPFGRSPNYAVCRIKQWLGMSGMRQRKEWIDAAKRARNLSDIFAALRGGA